jgi:hypothetical protein
MMYAGPPHKLLSVSLSYYRSAITAAATTPAIAIVATLASTLTHGMHSDRGREVRIRSPPCPMIMDEDRADLGDIDLRPHRYRPPKCLDPRTTFGNHQSV